MARIDLTVNLGSETNGVIDNIEFTNNAGNDVIISDASFAGYAEGNIPIGAGTNVLDFEYNSPRYKSDPQNLFLLSQSALESETSYDPENASTLVNTNEYGGTLFNDFPTNQSSVLVATVNTEYGTLVYELNIYFDSISGQKPSNIVVYDTNGYSNTAIITWSNGGYKANIKIGGSIAGVREIYMSNWSRTDYPFNVLYVDLKPSVVNLDKTWIDDISSTIEDKTNGADITYASISNTGSLDLRDRKTASSEDLGLLRFYAERGYFDTQKTTIDVLVNDSKIAQHTTIGSTYDNEDSILHLDLSDDIQHWTEITHEDIEFTVANYGTITLNDVFTTLIAKCFMEDGIFVEGTPDFSKARNTYIQCDLGVVTVDDYLSNIKIDNDFTLYAGNFQESLDKILLIAQLQCYIDYDGMPMFANARPLCTDEECSSDNIIVIPPEKQSNAFKSDVILTNKYLTVSFKGSGVYVIEVDEE